MSCAAPPKVGSRRIAFELGRHGCRGQMSSRMTVYRIMLRHGWRLWPNDDAAARTMGAGNRTGRWSCGRSNLPAGCEYPVRLASTESCWSRDQGR